MSRRCKGQAARAKGTDMGVQCLHHYSGKVILTIKGFDKKHHQGAKKGQRIGWWSTMGDQQMGAGYFWYKE